MSEGHSVLCRICFASSSLLLLRSYITATGRTSQPPQTAYGLNNQAATWPNAYYFTRLAHPRSLDSQRATLSTWPFRSQAHLKIKRDSVPYAISAVAFLRCCCCTFVNAAPQRGIKCSLIVSSSSATTTDSFLLPFRVPAGWWFCCLRARLLLCLLFLFACVNWWGVRGFTWSSLYI